MILPEFKKLYEPYTEDGASLEGSMKWLKKVTQMDTSVIESVVAETFIELAGGRVFGECECGCEIRNAHTAIEHYMRDRCLELNAVAEKAYWERVQERVQAQILSHIKKENEEYIAKNTKPHPFLDWNRSPIVNYWRRKFGS